MRENADKKPNVILINCDDLGYGDLSCYDSAEHSTPYLDGLAAQGRRFTDFYVGSSMCTPSRGCLLTGCYPPRIGFGEFNGEYVLFPGDDLGLNPEETSLARMFKNAGYNTLHVGKWHCGDQPGFLPTDHGFDDYYGLPFSNDMCRMTSRPHVPPLPLLHGSEVIQQQPDQSSLTERYVEKCVEFIRENSGAPFFLYLAHMHVHLPLYPAACFAAKSRNGDYGACVEAIDWSAGVLVSALKQCGIYEDTILIFTSDNGSRNDFGPSNGILRGTKATTYEGGLRVPFIVHWPGHISPGVSDGLFTAMDLYPTLAKIVGGTVPADRVIDGMDLSELLLGRTETSARDTFFYYMANNLEAVRSGDWKLHVSRRPGAGKPGPHDGTKGIHSQLHNNLPVQELYNLRNDPGEMNNVYAQHPDIVASLMKKIEACRDDLGDTFTGKAGRNVRPAGRVENAKPLTEYDPEHPYIIAMYDRNEVG